MPSLPVSQLPRLTYLPSTPLASLPPSLPAGATFGTATSALGVPETFPLRLSPQLLGVMFPLSAAATVRAGMSHALAVLSGPAASAALLTLLDVFVREPTMDWLQAASKREQGLGYTRAGAGAGAGRAGAAGDGAGGGDGDDLRSAAAAAAAEGAASWFPRTRLLLASLKLRRANPAHLLYVDFLHNSSWVPAPSARYATGSRGAAALGSTGVPAARWAEADRLLHGARGVILGDTRLRMSPQAAAALARSRCEDVAGEGASAGAAATGAAAAAATHVDALVRLRSLPQHAAPMRLSKANSRLLAASLGGPLAGNAEFGGSAALDAHLAQCRTVAAQVDCLLDYGTDPNVLVRQWVGLALWV